MFLGVEYQLDDRVVRVAVDRVDGVVPIATRGGGCRMVGVGQGAPFVDRSPGRFQSYPEGTLVSLDVLRKPSGPWLRWQTQVRPVKIAVSCFFYADALGFRRQQTLKPGQFLQGALLSKPLLERVYFVVVVAPGNIAAAGPWWPRVVGRLRA